MVLKVILITKEAAVRVKEHPHQPKCVTLSCMAQPVSAKVQRVLPHGFGLGVGRRAGGKVVW